MKNFIKTLSILLILSSSTYAQDLLNLNTFNFKAENYNTSYIAADSTSLDISTIVSSSNAAQNNSKFHFLLSGNIGKHGLALGAKVNTAFYQVFQTTTAEFLIAKKIQVGKQNTLSFGLNGGVILNSLKFDRINEYTNLEDPTLINGTYNNTGFTSGLGMNYSWNRKINIGISLPVLVQSNEGVSPVFFTNLSYNQKFKNNFSIKPELLIYGPSYTKPTFEGNVTLNYKEYLWVKTGIRSTQTVLFGLGGKIKFIDLGYMYNMSNGNPYNEAYIGMHSVNVSFHFLDKSLKPKEN